MKIEDMSTPPLKGTPLEGLEGLTLDEAAEAIEQREKQQLEKPWHVGFKDRGHGHGDYAVLVTGEDPESYFSLVAEVKCGEQAAQHIVDLHNRSLKEK
jgi:hypothetical protein